jgi:hypothetical protein
METHPLETLSHPHTAQHTELVAILRKLGRGDSSAGGGR